MIIRIAIIEDEESAVNRLRKELSKLSDYEFVVAQVLPSVKEAKAWFLSAPAIDLVFMDVQLSDGISFELFNQVDITCPVIFTTAYDEYALQAFRVNSLDYLLKPIDPKELSLSLKRYLAQSQTHAQHSYMKQLQEVAASYQPAQYRSSFLVNYKHKMVLVPVEQVAYFFIKERGVFMRTFDQKEYVVDFFLDVLEQQLDPRLFYRANRQFLISRPAILEVEPYFTGRMILNVKPEYQDPIIISKEKASDFKRWADY